MANQQHSSEIHVQLDDAQALAAIRTLSDTFARMQRTAQQAMQATGQAAGQATRQAQQGALGAGAAPQTATDAQREAEDARRREIAAHQREQATQQALQATRQAAQAVASGSGAGLLQAGAQGLGAGLQALGAGREGRLGGALRGLGAGLPVVGGLVGAALETRMARVGDVMGLERPQTELVTGAGYQFDQLYGARAAGARLGFTDAQTLATLQQVARGTQMQAQVSGGTLRALMQEELAGVGVGALSSFAGGGALGGGARGDVGVELGTALKLSATGRAMGLSGAGVERLLAAVAQNTSRMAERGLTLDTESFGDFVTAVSAAAQRAGDRQVMGVGAVRAAGRVTGMAQGALGQVTGQFGGLGQSALLAAAGRGARSPMELIANLEQLSGDPRAALAAMRGLGLGGDTLRMALVGGGASLAEAGALMGAGNLGMEAAGLSDAQQAQQARGMQVSSIVATKDNQLTRIVESDPASVQALMNLNTTLEKMSLQLTRSDGAVIKTVEGVGAVMETLLPAVEKLSDAVAGMIRFFGGR